MLIFFDGLRIEDKPNIEFKNILNINVFDLKIEEFEGPDKFRFLPIYIFISKGGRHSRKKLTTAQEFKSFSW